MKRIEKLLVLTLLFPFVFSSCRKDYSCKVDGLIIGTCMGCDKKKKETFEATCTAEGGVVVPEKNL
jgi:hypothetical protein